jgi:signal transduction histidine kinase
VIKKLLLFARQAPSKNERINLNQIIIDGLYFFEARCAKDGIELVRTLSPDLPEIIVDPAQLNQVLVNLVVNAIQAMPHGGKLSIETKAVSDHIILIVEDSGVGMSEDVLKKIFIPFFTTKDINEGTGLGLSVVHGIVTSHKGTIRAQSSVDKGSRFEIKLPISVTYNA